MEIDSLDSLKMHSREFFLSRICCGYLKYIVDGLFLQIRYPTTQVRYESCEVYNEYLERAKKEELLDEESVIDFMIDEGYWLQEDEAKLEYLPKHIEEFKVELFNSIYVPEQVKRLKTYLHVANTEYEKTQEKKHIYDYITQHGVANFAKWQYIVHKSTYLNDELYDWRAGNTYSALNHYYANMIPEQVIRGLARTQPWDTMWNASKKTGYIFPLRGIDMTLDQQRLICWSQMYDNIQESPDKPIERVIEDDDMLDGWLILERRKREKEDKGRFNKDKFDKGGKGDEVFVIAQSEEEVKEIMSLNTGMARANIRQRFKKIAEKGIVKDIEFDDVRRDLMMKATRLQSEMLHGRR